VPWPQRIEGILDTGFLHMICCIVLWYTLYQYVSIPARGCLRVAFR
jgi:hypothetical protein